MQPVIGQFADSLKPTMENYKKCEHPGLRFCVCCSSLRSLKQRSRTL